MKKYLLLMLITNQIIAGDESVFDLTTLNGDNGFVSYGTSISSNTGSNLSPIGDINADGIDDFIIGATGINNFAGRVYVVFGSETSNFGELQLSDLDGANGFIINGLNQQDVLSSGLAGIGDINNDGIDDIGIGARSANNTSGAAYFIFGKDTAFSSEVDLTQLDGTNGFTLNSMPNTGGNLGNAIAKAGDFNHDGISDVLVGSRRARVNNSSNKVGAVYVLFGRDTFAAVMTTDDISGANGMVIWGELENGQFGDTLANFGDFNNDGADDIVIGQYLASGIEERVYVIYGDLTGLPDVFNVSNINGSNGLKITANTVNDFFGQSIAADFDLNSDGFSDILIGAPRANGSINAYAGAAYVVFGQANYNEGTIDITDLVGSNGFVIGGEIEGANENIQLGYAVSSVGDFNSDGIDEIAFSSLNSGSYFQGSTYVLYGSTNSFTANFDVNTLNGENGFTIHGIDTGDKIGESLSRASDVNNDGVEDFLIGAPSESTNANSSGAVYAIFGQPQYYELVVAKQGDGTGFITADSGSINCGETCSDDYAKDTVVTLTVTADPQMEFVGWNYSECDDSGVCEVTMDQSREIIAEFINTDIIFSNGFE